ncbi:hypothetical protein IEQ34_026986 [Dendrobium chrysotoxum]|uniref:Uncharacterized protein n=1 Tax=Dendrobium chrysotoxum TaxID=161865 RepID=A0AAV7FIE9_DENCH|nr:hypothetical protein IEQ34_026986 [Dendrobium chrysotoxum]
MDNATAVGFRQSVARILMEMDIFRTYPDYVGLSLEKFGYIQKVVLEGFYSFCVHCKAVGHKNFEYIKLYPQLRKADVTSNQPHIVYVPIPVVEFGVLALNDLESDNAPILAGDSSKVPLNDHISALDNVRLGMGSLISPIIPPSEVECVNNNIDSPLVTPFGANSLKNLDCGGGKMDNIDHNSDSSSKHLISSFAGLSLSNDGCDVMGNFVASSSNPIMDSDLLIKGLDVSNSVPIIDLPVSPVPDVACINLDGELHKGLVDPVDHSDWIEEFSGNKCCDGGYL